MSFKHSTLAMFGGLEKGWEKVWSALGESLSHLAAVGTWEAVCAAVIALLAVLAFFRGVLRQLGGFMGLILGAFLGYQLFTRYESWQWSFLPEVSSQGLLMLSILTALGSWTLFKKISRAWIPLLFGALAIKFLGQEEGRGIKGALLSLIPSSTLVYLTTTALGLFGYLEDMDQTSQSVLAAEGQQKHGNHAWVKLKQELTSGLIGRWTSHLDPVSDPAARKLVKFLLLYQDEEAWQHLASNPNWKEVVWNPKIGELLQDPEIRDALQAQDYAYLMGHSKVLEAAEQEEIEMLLLQNQLDQDLEQALYVETASSMEVADHDEDSSAPRVRRARRLRFGHRGR